MCCSYQNTHHKHNPNTVSIPSLISLQVFSPLCKFTRIMPPYKFTGLPKGQLDVIRLMSLANAERMGAFEPKFRSMNDLHAWSELPNGKILDYTNATLKESCALSTDDVVRVPFSEEQQQECFVHWQTRYDENVKSGKMCESEGVSMDTLRHIFLNEGGWCQYKSLMIHEQTKGRAKVVFGSLGFRQLDGRVYYEYG